MNKLGWLLNWLTFPCGFCPATTTEFGDKEIEKELTGNIMDLSQWPSILQDYFSGQNNKKFKQLFALHVTCEYQIAMILNELCVRVLVNVFELECLYLPSLSDQTQVDESSGEEVPVVDHNGKKVDLDPLVFKTKIERFVQNTNARKDLLGVMVNFIFRFHYKYYELQTGVAVSEQTVNCGKWSTLSKQGEVCFALN